MKKVGTLVDAGETPGGCHLSNQGYLPTKRAKRVKWQAPLVTQSIHLVAEGDPKTHAVKGVAFSDILLFGFTRGDAGSLAPLNRQHYHGLHKGSPNGREQPQSKPQKRMTSIIDYNQ